MGGRSACAQGSLFLPRRNHACLRMRIAGLSHCSALNSDPFDETWRCRSRTAEGQMMWTLFEVVWGIVGVVIVVMWVGFTFGPAKFAEGVGYSLAETDRILVLFTALFLGVYAAIYGMGLWFGSAPSAVPLTDNLLAIPAVLLLNGFGLARKWQVLLSLAAGSCTAPGFLDSGLTVFASTLPRPARRGRVAPGRGFDSRISPASTVRCMSA